MKLVCCVVLFLYCKSNAFEIPEDMTYLVETLNPPVDKEGNKIFEGDMVLSKEQEKIIKSGDRAASDSLAEFWPNKTFYYRISPALANLKTIATAIKNWEDNTCIRFKVAPANAQAFVQFQKLEDSCFSELGYLAKRQIINLGFGCERLGIVEHEIAHSLGVSHEQSREDRDQFVTVINGNIEAGEEIQFEIVENTNTYAINYDLESLMHYGPLGFSANGGNTIVTNNPFDHFRIGQREGMSFDDKKLVNLMYRCSKNCAVRPHCRNFGFVNERCRCVCPAGTSGDLCQNGQRTFPVLDCGEDMTQGGVITSPGYPNNKAKAKCVWRITAPQQQRVLITFHNFRLYPRISPNHPNYPNWCFFDSVEVRTNSQPIGTKYCGQQLINRSIISDGNVLVIVFQRESDLQELQGFNATIQFLVNF